MHVSETHTLHHRTIWRTTEMICVWKTKTLLHKITATHCHYGTNTQHFLVAMHAPGWTHGGINNNQHNSGGWLKGSDCAIALARLIITVKSVFQASWPFQNIPVWQQTCNYAIIVHYHHTEHLSSLTMRTTSGCAPWSGLTTWLSSASVPFLLLNTDSTPTQQIPGGVFPGTEMLIHIWLSSTPPRCAIGLARSINQFPRLLTTAHCQWSSCICRTGVWPV